MAASRGLSIADRHRPQKEASWGPTVRVMCSSCVRPAVHTKLWRWLWLQWDLGISRKRARCYARILAAFGGDWPTCTGCMTEAVREPRVWAQVSWLVQTVLGKDIGRRVMRVYIVLGLETPGFPQSDLRARVVVASAIDRRQTLISDAIHGLLGLIFEAFFLHMIRRGTILWVPFWAIAAFVTICASRWVGDTVWRTDRRRQLVFITIGGLLACPLCLAVYDLPN